MGLFPYEDDLLKHYVRTEAWLPLCRKRLRTIRSASTIARRERRLRYFTFCAIGAIDVLMLDVANVIRPSEEGNFDTVVFFDLQSGDVDETRKRIPGAIGFAGDFVKIMSEPHIVVPDPLRPGVKANLLEVRDEQRREFVRQSFKDQFPFDVINLDLEEFLFKPTESVPGDVVNAMRRVFELQKSSFIPFHGRSSITIEGFSLMFTTRIGPQNMSEDYLNIISDSLHSNMRDVPGLAQILNKRTGLVDPMVLRERAFEEFFKIGVPKVIAAVVRETDWHVDPDQGITIFEFERTPKGVDPYKMLHMVMDIKRNNPALNSRAPGAPANDANDAYRIVASQLFSNRPVVVADGMLDKPALRENLERIIRRRARYFPEGDPL